MSHGIECLLADQGARAEALAQRLDKLNRERREIEAEMKSQALEALESLSDELASPDLPAGLVLYDERWHQGVVGILAARVRDLTNRPVIAFAPAGDGELKGSARSIQALHVRDLLSSVAALRPGLIHRFGGHAMAAGLSLAPDQLDLFRQAFAEQALATLGGEIPASELLTDGELAPAQLEIELAELLRRAAPWGKGFPEPRFDGVFRVENYRVVGEKHLRLRLRTLEESRRVEAIAFNYGDVDGAEVGERVRLVYRLEVNEFRGQRSLQLTIDHLEPAG
jgi:single-stranded-DNA-specific exonuclease